MVGLVTLVAVALLAGIGVTLAYGYSQGNGAAVVNATVSLAAALLPLALATILSAWVGWTVEVPPALTFWLALAGLLHSIGMLGPYDSVWWWDHLTHLVSAALVGALLYAGLIALAQAPGGFRATSIEIAVLAVLLTLLAGLFWELLELVAREVGERVDVDPVLVHYGWRDTAFDLIFDVLGGVLVVALDVRAFVPLAEASIRATWTVLLATSGLFVLGSVAFVVLVFGEART